MPSDSAKAGRSNPATDGSTAGAPAQPGVSLRPIDRAQYEAWLERTTAEYAASHVEAGNWPAEGALERSRAEFRELLPQGPQTPDHFVWSVRDEAGQHVGVLWVAPSKAPGSLFIWDIVIEPEARGRGLGRATLEALHAWAREHGFTRVRLHVFGSNAVARRLYEHAGYVETDVMMEKRLEAS